MRSLSSDSLTPTKSVMLVEVGFSQISGSQMRWRNPIWTLIIYSFLDIEVRVVEVW